MKNIEESKNISNTLINIGGRIGNLMDITSESLNPNSQDGKNIMSLIKSSFKNIKSFI